MDPQRHDHDGPRGHLLEPTLIRLVKCGQLDMAPLITHRFPLDDLLQAYEVFADAGHSGALKVVLTR